MTYGEPWAGAGLLAVGGAVAAYRKFRDWKTPDEGTTEHAQHMYATGEIDHAELERRLDVLEDPEAMRIREATERISGIGEQTSWDIAARFESLDDLRAASAAELTNVPNVGSERAAAIQEAV